MSCILTKYVRVGEKKVVMMELQQMVSNRKKERMKIQKIEKRVLHEIQTLLYEVLTSRVSQGHIKDKVKDKSATDCIIFGKHVQLGYVFKKRYVHQMLLLSETSDNSEDEDPYHKSYSIHDEKLVVFYCTVEPGSPSRMSQLLRAVQKERGSGNPHNQTVSISSYFHRASGGGTQMSHDQTGGGGNRVVKHGNDAGAAEESEIEVVTISDEKIDKENCVKILSTGNCTDMVKDIHAVIKGLEFIITENGVMLRFGACLRIKRSGPCLSKKRKKYMISENTDESDDTEHEAVLLHKNVEKKDSCDDIVVVDEKKQNNIGIRDTKVRRKCNQQQDCEKNNDSIKKNNSQSKRPDHTSKRLKTDNDPNPSDEVRENLLCDSDDSIAPDDSILPEISFLKKGRKSKHRISSGPKNFEKISLDKSGKYVSTYIDKSSKHVSTESIEQEELEEGSISASPSKVNNVISSKSKQECREEREEDTPPTTSNTISPKFRRQRISMILSQVFISDDSEEEHVQNIKSKTIQECRVSSSISQLETDENAENFQVMNFAAEEPSKRCAINRRNIREVSAPMIHYTENEDSLPLLNRPNSKRDINSAKTPSMNVGKNSKQKTLHSMIAKSDLKHCSKINSKVIQEELECEDMEGSILETDLANTILEEIRSVRSVDRLTPRQLQFLVDYHKIYLQDIFREKILSDRHLSYKIGGKERKDLNYRVHLGLFTDDQQDIVMETLMKIFCKKRHKYLDYIMKVLLPEMLIKIYMEVKAVSHEEAEEHMQQAVTVPGGIHN